MLDWRVALIVWGGFVILTALTRYVSLGSLYAGTAFPFATYFVMHSLVLAVLAGCCGGLLASGLSVYIVLFKGTGEQIYLSSQKVTGTEESPLDFSVC